MRPFTYESMRPPRSCRTDEQVYDWYKAKFEGAIDLLASAFSSSQLIALNKLCGRTDTHQTVGKRRAAHSKNRLAKRLITAEAGWHWVDPAQLAVREAGQTAHVEEEEVVQRGPPVTKGKTLSRPFDYADIDCSELELPTRDVFLCYKNCECYRYYIWNRSDFSTVEEQCRRIAVICQLSQQSDAQIKVTLKGPERAVSRITGMLEVLQKVSLICIKKKASEIRALRL